MKRKTVLTLMFSFLAISAGTSNADDFDPLRCADCIQSRIDCRQQARAIAAECYGQAIAANTRCRQDVDRCSDPNTSGTCLYYECRPEGACPDCCAARRAEEFAQCQAWLDNDAAVCDGSFALDMSGCRYSCVQWCVDDPDPDKEG